MDIQEFHGIFPPRRTTPPYIHSLFQAGELPEREIAHHSEGAFTDSHPGGIHHEHAYERIIAKKFERKIGL